MSVQEVHPPAAVEQRRQQQPSQAGLANLVIGSSDEPVDGEEPAAEGLGALAGRPTGMHVRSACT